jgi:hypothetical protein
MMFIAIPTDWLYCTSPTRKARQPLIVIDFVFLNLRSFSDSPTNLPDSEPLPWFSVDYRRLYNVLCHTVHTDQSTLLLYMLLHRNQHFKAYVISRTNIDQIVRCLFLGCRTKCIALFEFVGLASSSRDLCSN